MKTKNMLVVTIAIIIAMIVTVIAMPVKASTADSFVMELEDLQIIASHDAGITIIASSVWCENKRKLTAVFQGKTLAWFYQERAYNNRSWFIIHGKTFDEPSAAANYLKQFIPLSITKIAQSRTQFGFLLQGVGRDDLIKVKQLDYIGRSTTQSTVDTNGWHWFPINRYAIRATITLYHNGSRISTTTIALR